MLTEALRPDASFSTIKKGSAICASFLLAFWKGLCYNNKPMAVRRKAFRRAALRRSKTAVLFRHTMVIIVRRHAGLVYRYYSSFPSWLGGFDSRTLLHVGDHSARLEKGNRESGCLFLICAACLLLSKSDPLRWAPILRKKEAAHQSGPELLK